MGTRTLGLNSNSGGIYKVTLSAGAGQGPNIPCRSCLVKPNSSNTSDVMVNIGTVAYEDRGTLDATWTPIPVSNLSLLHFYSEDDDAIVEILYRG